MPNEVKKNSLVLSISNDEKKALLDKAIGSMIARKGEPPPRGPRPERAGPNHTAIGVLKSPIMRSEFTIEQAEWNIRTAKQSLQYAESVLSRLRSHRRDDMETLAMIAEAEGVEINWHELNESCNDEKCRDCCEHEERTDGKCDFCGDEEE